MFLALFIFSYLFIGCVLVATASVVEWSYRSDFNNAGPFTLFLVLTWPISLAMMLLILCCAVMKKCVRFVVRYFKKEEVNER